MSSVAAQRLVLPLMVGMVVMQLFFAPIGRSVLLGLQLLMMITIVSLCFQGKARICFLFFLMIWGAVAYFNYLNLDMAVSPDAVKYRDYYYTFKGDPSEFFASIYKEFKESEYYDVSSYSVVAVFFYPVAYWFDDTSIDSVFLIMNLVFAFGTVFFHWGAIDRLSFRYNRAKKYSFFLWIFSPVVVYHYQVFSKDIFSCFLCAASVYFFAGKRLFLGIVFLVLATMLRPYSVAIIFSIYFFVADDAKRLIQGGLASFVVVVFFAGLDGLINSILVLLYMPISPNFFSFAVERNDYFPLYMESFTFFLGILFFLISWSLSKSVRAFSMHCLLAIFIYACVMTVLGKYSADHYDTVYQVGTMGNNALRKKIPILPIYISMIVVALSFFGNRELKK